MKRFLTITLAALSLLTAATGAHAADKTPLASYPNEPNQPIKSIDTAKVPALKATGATDLQASLQLSGDITPAQITADQNDYNPTSLSTASVLRLSTDASRNLTGLQGGADGRWITIVNVGPFDLVLKNASASSSAPNRFAMDSDWTMAANTSAVLGYDATSSRWRLLGTGKATAGTSGSVTSVGLSLPSEFSVSGTPVTGTGTLTGSWASQTANKVFASPNGSSGTPSFRTLVGPDLPNPSSSTLGGVESIAASSHKWINSISTSGVPSQTQPSCADLSDASSFCSGNLGNPFCYTGSNTPCFRYGSAAPSSTDPMGSLYQRTGIPRLYRMWTPATTVPARVQEVAALSNVVTFGATPTANDYLIGFCYGAGAITNNSGWTQLGSQAQNVWQPAETVVYKLAGGSESTSQTPCTGGTINDTTAIEVSGLDASNWSNTFVSLTLNGLQGSPVTATGTASGSSTLAVFSSGQAGGTAGGTYAGSPGSWSNTQTASGGVGPYKTFIGSQLPGAGSVSGTTTTSMTGTAVALLLLAPATNDTIGWQPMSDLNVIYNSGSQITSSARSINFSTGLLATDDGNGHTTVTATGGGSSVDPFVPPSTAVPTTSTFTVVSGAGSPSMSQTTRGVLLAVPGAAAVDRNALLEVTPANSTWTMTALLVPTTWWRNYLTFGLYAKESATGKIHAFTQSYDSGVVFRQLRWTNITTFSASTDLPTIQLQGPIWIRLVLDATNFTASLSEDGEAWLQVYQVARGTFLTGTINRAGVFVGINQQTTGSYPQNVTEYVHVMYFSIS